MSSISGVATSASLASSAVSMSQERAKFFEAIQNQKYVSVPFLVDPNLIQDAIHAFFEFLNTPDHIKHHIDFKITQTHRRGDVGFKRRESAADIYNDSKDFFHFHPALFDQYADFLKDNPVVDAFVKKAKPIWDLAYAKTLEILKLFDDRYPETSAKVFDKEPVHLLLRFLKYDWQRSEKYLAKPHFDAGSFTLAIAESCAGLRIGSGPDDLKLIQHQDGHALFMLSSNFKKVLNTDEFQAGWHDVIQLDETKIGQPFARWAIVAFIDAHGVEALPRTETHKWYTQSAHAE